jgi:transcriptional regulator with XRE-family HTH domain
VTAGSELRQARSEAGLTQRELARRAGVSQSVIADYESGAREPSLATLAALVNARGVTLTLSLDAGGDSRRLRATRPIGRRLRRPTAAVMALARKHDVTDVRVFGSVARGDESPDFDLDLLVHLPAGAGLLALG